MSLSELGSLGEFIASIATLITLIYLALQIRENSRNLKKETVRGSLVDASTWRSHIIDSPDIANLYRTGLMEPDKLEASDRIRFRMLMHSLVEIWAIAYEYDEQRLAAQEKYIIDTLSQAGGVLAWKGFEHSQSPEFRDYVNGLLDR
jgi:hypothetical protein